MNALLSVEATRESARACLSVDSVSGFRDSLLFVGAAGRRQCIESDFKESTTQNGEQLREYRHVCTAPFC